MMQSRYRQNRRRKKPGFRLSAVSFGLILFAVLFAALLQSCAVWTTRETEGRKEENRTSRDTDSDSQTEEAGTRSDTGTAAWERIKLPEITLAEGNLVLVNAEHAIDASRAETLSVYEYKTDSYYVKNVRLSVTPETMEALNAWMDDFAIVTGINDVNIVAGWRSYDDQAALYGNAVAKKGQTHADAYIALPGHSEHHTGLAVDLDTYDLATGTSGGFAGSGDYAWAVTNAWKYGFIQRYPPAKSAITGIDFESWHFRYVGLPHSYLMATQNLCLEEYIELLRSYPFSGEHLRVSCLDRSYELYFCPEEELVVPKSGDYTISGNNVDGYIVVVEKP